MKLGFWYQERPVGGPPAVTWLWLWFPKFFLDWLVLEDGTGISKCRYKVTNIHNTETRRANVSAVLIFTAVRITNLRPVFFWGVVLRNWLNSMVEKSENVSSWTFLLLKVGPLISVKSSGATFPLTNYYTSEELRFQLHHYESREAGNFRERLYFPLSKQYGWYRHTT